MAVDLQQEVQRLAGLVQSGEITRETFQAQVKELKGRAKAAARDAATNRRLRPVVVQHRSSPIVESGPDVRAGARTFSWTLALLALAVIAVAAVSSARGDTSVWRMPSLDLPEFSAPRIRLPERAPPPPKPPEAEAAPATPAPAVEPAPTPEAPALEQPAKPDAEAKP